MTVGIAPSAPNTPDSPAPPKVSFSPKTLSVKELGHGERATLRLKVKTDRPIGLEANSPHLRVFPERLGPGSTLCTITVDSKELELGSVFKAAIEVSDFDEYSVPVEAKVSAPKVSLARSLGMYTLCCLTLVPLLNFATTTIAAIVMFSTPKNKRASLKLAWRLTLLFTIGWSAFFVAVGMGLSMVDWSDLTDQIQSWTSSLTE